MQNQDGRENPWVPEAAPEDGGSFQNQGLQKLYKQLNAEKPLYGKSWSEEDLKNKKSSKSSESADSKSEDRFVPSTKDLLKSLAKSEKKSSGTKSSSSSSRSSGEWSENKANLNQESRRFIVSLGALCFVIGGILLFYLYGPWSSDLALEGSPGGAASSLPVSGEIIDSNLPGGSGGSVSTGEAGAEVTLEIENTTQPKQKQATAPLRTKEFKPTSSLPGIKVYVVGAVKNPGIVSLPFNSRVDDAIKAAGGMTAEAEPLSVNLAKRIKDEDKIYVASKTESSEVASQKVNPAILERSGVVPQKDELLGMSANTNKSESSATKSPKSKSESQDDAAPPKNSNLINLNTATEEELQKIPGIGPSISKSILDYRKKLPNGRFTDLSQLKEVSGIGKKSYNKFAPFLKVE